MARTLSRQAEDLYRSFSRLVRRYQFRDREDLSCHGISVSQCYALSHLRSNGPCTMSGVAEALSLELSSVTRLADQLEERRLIRRKRDEDDRRVCRLHLTRKGKELVDSIEATIMEEHRAVLQEIPAASREAVISAMEGLLAAYDRRGT